jgi:predicted nucleic acid-binding protein
MAVYYLDTSALVKLYVQELGTDVVLSLASDLENDRLAILDLARVELRAAVRRRERANDVVSTQAFQILSQFDQHLSELYLTQPCNSSVVEEAVRLLDHHALRAYDAVQLAGAIVLQAGGLTEMTFVCADKDLVQVAKAEGLAVIDPEAREAELAETAAE